ncbi:MAG: DUF4349 domain-containing protein [Clostridiaceae bacterium]|nr:DUF4349 domain-containing protein [Clostridiaceae bacterium]
MYKYNKKNGPSFKKTFITLSLLLIVSLMFASCGSSGKSTAPAMDKAAYDENMAYSYAEAAPQAPAPAPAEPVSGESGLGESDYKDKVSADSIMSQRKVIMEGDVSLETLDFDDSISAMDQMIKDFGGFAEARNVRGKSKNSKALRSASYIIRVPAESFELVLKSMGSIGTVLESASKGTDITDQYYDAKTRIRTLKVQEETLLDILAKSTNLEDVINLERRIAEVRYEIESLENTINNYDRLVSFSRINVYIQEVDDKTETKPEPETLGQRISGTFAESIDNFKTGFENFLIWFVYSWINIIIFLIIVGIAILIFKKSKRRSAKKAAKKEETVNEEVKDK